MKHGRRISKYYYSILIYQSELRFIDKANDIPRIKRQCKKKNTVNKNK